MNETISNYIIIHPGNYNLYVGFGDDNDPLCFVHAIAYKYKNNSSSFEEDKYYPNIPIKPIDNFDRKYLVDVVKTLKLLDSSNYNPSSSLDKNENNSKFSYNEIHCKQIENESDELTDLDSEFIIGKDIFKMNSKNYIVKWIYSDIINNNTSQSALTELEKNLIVYHWSYALEKLFESKDMKMDCSNKKFLLLVPDFFDRNSIILMMDILIKELKFDAGTVIQESVAVSYYARCQSICVVDIGHSKTSISCVEDGVSIPKSRITLNFGSSLISSALYYLLKDSLFPVKNFNPFKNFYHFKLLEDIKVKTCHLHPNVDSYNSYTIDWDSFNGDKLDNIEFSLGEEPLLASTVYFSHPFLSLVDSNIAKPFYYIDYDTSSDILISYPLCSGFTGLNLGITQLLSSEGSSPNLNEEEITSSLSVSDDQSGFNNVSKCDISATTPYCPLKLETDVLSLSEAIMNSIFTCNDIEQQSRMFANIYIVGGGSIIQDADNFLQYRIEAQLPRGKKYKEVVVDVVSSTMDCHPCHTAFKGACNISQTPSIDEYIVTSYQWNYHGVRALRERCLFQWSHF